MEQDNFGPSLFIDRTLLTSLPSKVAKELSRRGLTTPGHMEKASFVGLLMVENQSYVFLPRGSVINEDKKIKHASNTLKAVEKYGRLSKTRIDLFDEGLGEIKHSKLSLICSLLEDYRLNGIYTKRRTLTKLNIGKTDWKRTISRVTAYPGFNGAPVYIDNYGVKKKYFDDCEIAAIHASIISKLDRSYSWVVTGHLTPIAPELNNYPDPQGTSSFQISRLRQELNLTYSDRDIQLLKSLISYLKAEAGEQSSNLIIGLTNFHFCWEYMLGQVLQHTVSLNKYLPAPAYIDKDNKVITANDKAMRTDIILHDKNTDNCTVADAKYYAATSVSNAPGWGDIVKQLFYEKALSTLDITWEIKNAFIFPGVDGLLSKAKIRDRVKSKNDSHIFVEEFQPIHCYYADPMDVVTAFITGSKMKDFSSKLLEEITD